MISAELMYEKVMHRMDMTKETKEEELQEIIRTVLEDESKKEFIPLSEKIRLSRELFNAFRRLDILQDLIEDDSITEITCHAKGAHYLNPNVRTVIDIGGQDIKAISIDENGAVKNFLMNDKCAAGTGRFLEMMARTLGLSLEEMSTMGLEWKENIVISSMCTVFAESEVVSLVAQNKAVSDIIHGLNMSVASKVGALAARLGQDNPGEYMMTGGVAKNKGITNALEEKLGAKLYICDEAQLCGALGAALFAYEKCREA